MCKHVPIAINTRMLRKLKENMGKLKDTNWSEEIKRFIEEKTTEYKVNKILKRTEEHLKDLPELPSGTISKWLRIDRKSH